MLENKSIEDESLAHFIKRMTALYFNLEEEQETISKENDDHDRAKSLPRGDWIIGKVQRRIL